MALCNCPSGNTIQIPASHLCYLSDNEIERRCLYESSPVGDIWADSYLEKSGKIQEKQYKPTSLDDMEEYLEDEEEEEDTGIDTDMSLSGWE